MATGTSFDVTVRVLLSNYEADLQAIVTIDSNPFTTSPLYYGSSQLYLLKTNSYVKVVPASPYYIKGTMITSNSIIDVVPGGSTSIEMNIYLNPTYDTSVGATM